MKKIIAHMLLIVAGFCVGVVITFYFNPLGFLFTGVQTQDFSDLGVEGFSLARVDAGTDFVMLTSGCRRLVLVTNEYQAASIADGLTGRVSRRPSSHDLMVEVLRAYSVYPLMVKVHELEYNTYKAKLYLLGGNKMMILDSKPTDAIAVAVRADRPVYLKTNLLNNYGEKVC